MTASVERVVTSGVFSLDGQDFDVENNVWLVGDESEVVVVDAAHEAATILDAVGDRTLVAIVCTHAHNDHINAVAEIVAATGAPVRLHPDDRMLWDVVNPQLEPVPIADGDVVSVAGIDLHVLHTPGPLARRRLPLLARPRRGAQRRHALPRWTGRDRSVVQPLPDDPGLHP